MKPKIFTSIFIFFSLFLLLLNTANSQSVWTTQYLSGVNESQLRKIQFINQLTGWACGSNGTLIKTTNGGENWTLVSLGTNNYLTSLYFLDQNTGWVGADDSFIRKTTNGGLSWYSAPVQVETGLWSAEFSFLNSQTGYVMCCTRASKTTDGGLSWDLVSTGLPMYGPVKFFDEQSGYAMGTGYFGKTSNGGASWTQILSGTNVSQAFYFLDQQTGWVAGSNTIRKTTDAGDTWAFINIPVQTPYGLKFLDQNLGWCVGVSNGNGVISRTIDGGLNWVTQKTEPNNNYWDISFINHSTGWVSGNGIISSTENGNITTVTQISSQVPEKYSLKQNYPNPFNPSTIINFDIKNSTFASLVIYDMNGREVKTLVNQNLSAGSYNYDFNAGELTTGVYFYTLTTSDFKETKKMMLVK